MHKVVYRSDMIGKEFADDSETVGVLVVVALVADVVEKLLGVALIML